MKTFLKIFIPVVLAAVIGIAAYFIYQSSKFVANDKYATGNTTGNLNNGGKFCEYEGNIYFSNPYDLGRLYVMDADCTNAKILSTNTASSINVCGKYIYYVKNNFSKDAIERGDRTKLFGVIRMDLNGGNELDLYKDKAGIASLCGNSIYYQQYTDDTNATMYTVTNTNSDSKQISTTVYSPACVYNGRIYYADASKRNNVYSYDTTTEKTTMVSDVSAYLVDLDGNYMYYLDLSKKYTLVRMNMQTKTIEQIYAPADGKIINYNRYGTKIFMIVEDGTNPGLYRCNLDGTNVEYIASGRISSVSCTSQYAFFQYYEDSETLYRVPTLGNITSVEEISIKSE
jgi:hypothetical protein